MTDFVELNLYGQGKLRLKPTVVGLSKFDESVQKLKNGQVAGYVFLSNQNTHVY